MKRHWSESLERPEPDAIRIHARYLYDGALSILDQTHAGTRAHDDMARFAELAHDLQQATVALADAADRCSLLPLPKHIRFDDDLLARAAGHALEYLRAVSGHMADLDRAATVQRSEPTNAR